MRTERLALLFSVSCGAFGCGGTVTVEEALDPPAQDPVEDPADPADPTPAAPDPCQLGGALDPARPVLAWLRGLDVVFVRADGSDFVAHSFAEPNPGASGWGSLSARDGFVAASAGVSLGDGKSYTASTLLSAEGEVLWDSGLTQIAYPQVYLGEKGTLALANSDVGGDTDTLLRWANGTSAEIAGLRALGGPSLDGAFPALLTPGGDLFQYGWVKPAAGPEPLAFPATSGGVPHFAEGRLFYLGLTDPESGQTAVVVETKDSVQSLPVAAIFPGVTAAVGDFALVRGDYLWEAPRFLVDGKNGTLAQVAPPGNGVAFGYAYYNGASLDDQGGVSLPLRTSSLGGVYRTRDLGESWELIGESFSDVWDVSLTARGGTFVIVTSDAPGYFPMEPWESPAAGDPAPAQHGPGVQVARPDAAITRALPPGATSFALSKGGGCLAYVDDNRLRVLDVSTGDERELTEGDATQSPRTPVWLE